MPFEKFDTRAHVGAETGLSGWSGASTPPAPHTGGPDGAPDRVSASAPVLGDAATALLTEYRQVARQYDLTGALIDLAADQARAAREGGDTAEAARYSAEARRLLVEEYVPLRERVLALYEQMPPDLQREVDGETGRDVVWAGG